MRDHFRARGRFWFGSRLNANLAASIAIVALSAVGCAGNLQPHVAPIPVHPIPVGINDSWHRVLTPAEFALDCPAMIRTPQTSGPALADFLAAAPAGCPVLALVEAARRNDKGEWDVSLVRAFAKVNPPAIELANEPELKPTELTPEAYGDWIAVAVAALIDEGYRGTIVLGAVYALTPETKRAMLLGIASCLVQGVNCVAAVHLYDASDEDLDWLRWLTQTYVGLRVWVTELGAHDNCDPNKIAAKKQWLQSQIDRFSTVFGLDRVFIYQRPRGSDCSDFSTFGIDGQPAQELLR